MIPRNSIIYLFICATLFAPNDAKADNSAKTPNVQTTKAATDTSKQKQSTDKKSTSYPAPNQVFRNDGKTPSCVSSPELSGAGDTKNAFPDLNLRK